MGVNIDAIYEELSKHNESLKKLIEENTRLNETIFEETGKRRVERLIELTQKRNEELNKVIEAVNKDLNKTISIDTITDDLSKLRQEINATQKELRNLSKKDPDYEKKHNDALSKLEEQRNAYNLLNDAANNFYSAANDEQKELNKRQLEGIHILDDWGEGWEQRTRAIRKGAGEVSKGVSQIYQSVTKTLEPWAKANQEAMSYARTMGMSQKTADSYLSNTVSWAAKNNIGILFNKSTDELIKLQGKYSEVLGRNVQLTNEQKLDMLAMEKFLGEDGMIDIANNLENFGLGMSDSAEFIKETLDEATKTGVAASKLTKTIRENIKMAQNYTFKNGLEGLSNMAKKAVELKTDMSLVNSFLEKVSTVEGAITTGANLQVLGGSYAIGSDPLSMMYESLNDVEGLFDRVVNMASGKVFYNNESGNFEMAAIDRYLMKQAATTMGVDPAKMIDVAFRKASLDKIEGEAKSNAKIANDEDMIELVKNIATYDKGRAVVNINGKDKAVSELTSADKAQLEAMQRTDSQNLQDMAISLRSMNEILGGTEKEINNEQAKSTERAATGINALLRQNTKMLDITAKIGAWINIIGGGAGILGGVWTTATGVLRMGKGLGNLGLGKLNTGRSNTNLPNFIKNSRLRTSIRGMKGNIITSSTGQQWRSIGGGRFENVKDPTKVLSKNAAQGMLRGSSSVTTLGTAGKLLKAGGTGLAAGAFSIGSDMLSGEFKRDTGGSIGRAAGATAGAALGSLLTPFIGPLGPILGGWAGSAIVGAFQDAQKDTRKQIRNEISSRLVDVAPQVANLFTGADALVGNYNKRQLEKLSKALEDGRIDEGELSGAILRKARANNDLSRMQGQGIDVRVAMANGGYLDGKKHSEGGMPILGSNISVEGGEFVVNREATKVTRPLLEQINNGDYSMIAKQPLGEQMKVHQNRSNVETMPHASKIKMEPISLNISGTIKLDAGNKQVDISNELLNNPVLISKLTEMINKQINILDNNAYNKGNFKQKFI